MLYFNQAVVKNDFYLSLLAEIIIGEKSNNSSNLFYMLFLRM